MLPKHVYYASTHFWGGILNSCLTWLSLMKKKCGTIPEILPWILKFMSVYKLVVLNTFNGFFSTKFDQTLDIWQLKSHYFYSVLFMKLTRWLRGGDRRVTRALRNKVAKFDSKKTIFTNSYQIVTKNLYNSRIPLQRRPL